MQLRQNSEMANSSRYTFNAISMLGTKACRNLGTVAMACERVNLDTHSPCECAKKQGETAEKRAEGVEN